MVALDLLAILKERPGGWHLRPRRSRPLQWLPGRSRHSRKFGCELTATATDWLTVGRPSAAAAPFRNARQTWTTSLITVNSPEASSHSTPLVVFRTEFAPALAP